MKNLVKKVSSVVCCAILALSLNANVFAASSNNLNKPTKLPLLEQSENTKSGTIVITDKEQIAKIAKQQNLNDPDSITKITYDFRNSSKIQGDQPTSFTVPANHQIELRVFTNYQEKSFDVGNDYGGLLYYSGSGTAQRPVGLIFQQIQR